MVESEAVTLLPWMRRSLEIASELESSTIPVGDPAAGLMTSARSVTLLESPLTSVAWMSESETTQSLFASTVLGNSSVWSETVPWVAKKLELRVPGFRAEISRAP